MRKYLLGTTALVAATAVATSAMAMPIQSTTDAGVPILTVNMMTQWEAGIASNDNNNSSANTRDGGFINGRFAEIFFDGVMTADNGLVYGASVHFNTGVGESYGFPGREFMYLNGGWGSLEFGKWIGADSGLNICVTCRTYAGNGGIDTPWKSYIISPNANFRNGSVNSMWFDQSVKITYYTPTVAGIQAGVSYAPSRDAFAAPLAAFTDNDGQHKDLIQVGVQFNQEFDGVAISLSASGAVSDSHLSSGTFTTGTNSTREVTGVGYYELGAQVRYAGFRFGGSWWDDGNGGAIKGRDYGFKKVGWTLAAAYFTGPYSMEVQYAASETTSSNRVITAAIASANLGGGAGTGVSAAPSAYTDGYDVNMWNIGFGYAVAPGLKWYAEVTGAEFDHSQSANDITDNGAINLDNDAVAIITGIQINF